MLVLPCFMVPDSIMRALFARAPSPASSLPWRSGAAKLPSASRLTGRAMLKLLRVRLAQRWAVSVVAYKELAAGPVHVWFAPIVLKKSVLDRFCG